MNLKRLFGSAVLLAVLMLGAEDRVIIQQPQEFFIGLHDNQAWMLPAWDAQMVKNSPAIWETWV